MFRVMMSWKGKDGVLFELPLSQVLKLAAQGLFRTTARRILRFQQRLMWFHQKPKTWNSLANGIASDVARIADAKNLLGKFQCNIRV